MTATMAATSVDFTPVWEQQQSQSQMPSQAYGSYAIGPPKVSLSFRVDPPANFSILVSVMVSDFCFQVPMWLPSSPVGAQPLGFAPLQLFIVYP